VRRLKELSFLLSLIVLFLSCGKHPEGWNGSIEIIDGVSWVKNPRIPKYADDTLTIQEDLKIGDTGGEGSYLFASIHLLAVDDDGRIYVADAKEKHISVFDQTGKLLKIIGGPGQGPGEFAWITDLQITAKNQLMAHDDRGRRIQHFTLDGNMVYSQDTNGIRGQVKGNIFPSSFHLSYDLAQNYLVEVAILVGMKAHRELLKIDSDLNRASKIMEIPEWDVTQTDPDRTTDIYYAVTSKNEIAVGFPKTYELKLFDSAGSLKKVISRDYAPVPLSEKEKEDYQKIYLPDRVDPPTVHSAFQYLAADEKGRYFVDTWEKPENGAGRYIDVFNPDGKYLCRFLLDAKPKVIKKDHIYTIETDEDGYQCVRRYRMIWKQ
jgi:6-bladed beta-propeller